MLIICSFHGVEWNHPTACRFQKGKHKHGEALVGSWRADRCQNQGECFYSLNMMLSLLGNGLRFFFFYLFGFFVCFFLSQRLGTSRFIARHSASVIALYVLSLHWDIKCTCYKWLKGNPTKHQKIFSWTEFQKHWILLLQKYTVLKLELNLYGDSKNNLKRNIFVAFFCIQNPTFSFQIIYFIYIVFCGVRLKSSRHWC